MKADDMRNENDLNKYIDIVKRFKSYYRDIIKIKPILIEYEKKIRDKRIKSRLWQIIIPIITAIIGAVIGWVLSIS
jgi:hypothetical protein